MFDLTLFTALVFGGFGLTTPLLAGLYRLWPRGRFALRRLLAVSAGLLLLAACVVLAQTLLSGLQAGVSPADFDRYAWLNRLGGPYWLAYWVPLVGQGLMLWVFERNNWHLRPPFPNA